MKTSPVTSKSAGVVSSAGAAPSSLPGQAERGEGDGAWVAPQTDSASSGVIAVPVVALFELLGSVPWGRPPGVLR